MKGVDCLWLFFLKYPGRLHSLGVSFISFLWPSKFLWQKTKKTKSSHGHSRLSSIVATTRVPEIKAFSNSSGNFPQFFPSQRGWRPWHPHRRSWECSKRINMNIIHRQSNSAEALSCFIRAPNGLKPQVWRVRMNNKSCVFTVSHSVDTLAALGYNCVAAFVMQVIIVIDYLQASTSCNIPSSQKTVFLCFIINLEARKHSLCQFSGLSCTFAL